MGPLNSREIGFGRSTNGNLTAEDSEKFGSSCSVHFPIHVKLLSIEEIDEVKYRP